MIVTLADAEKEYRNRLLAFEKIPFDSFPSDQRSRAYDHVRRAEQLYMSMLREDTLNKGK